MGGAAGRPGVGSWASGKGGCPMRGSIPILLVIALSGCAAQRQGRSKPADRTLAHNVCPQPGAAEQAQAALAVRSRFVALISSDETLAFGPPPTTPTPPSTASSNPCP